MPTFIVILIGFNALDLLVYSQVIMSFLIPLPLISMIYITSKQSIMGQFVNRNVTTFVAVVFAVLIMSLNAYLLLEGVLRA